MAQAQSNQLVPGWPVLTSSNPPQVGIGSEGAVQTDPSSAIGAASATVTIGGTTGVGPTVTVTLNGNAVTYTYVAGDSSTTIAATDITTALNANGSFSAIATATSSANVITITAKSNGTAGMYSLTAGATGGATATASYTKLDLANGWVNPLTTFSYAAPGSFGSIDFVYNSPRQVDAATKSDLRTNGLIA